MVAFSNTGPIWVVTLDENETQHLPALMGAGGAVASAVAGPLAPAVIGGIGAAIGYIIEIDNYGGHQGVDITGVVGAPGVIVTPRASGFYAELARAAAVNVNSPTIIDFLIKAILEIPGIGNNLAFAPVGAVLGQVLTGTPLGAALVAGLTIAGITIFSHTPDPNEHGHVQADRDRADAWERFVMAQLGNGNQVSLLSWVGTFSAQDGGGSGVYANRPWVQDWEKWTLIDNHDGSASFQTINGHYLSARLGGGSFCTADRTAIGSWERFYIENQPGGRIALKTHDQGKYVSVQP